MSTTEAVAGLGILGASRECERQLPSSIRTLLGIITKRPQIDSIAGGLPFVTGTEQELEIDGYLTSSSRTKNRILQYAPIDGVPELSEEFSRFLFETEGLKIDPDQCTFTNGAQAGLDILARMLLDEGDVCFVCRPDYLGALRAFEARGAELIAISMDDQGMVVEELADKLLKHNGRAKFVYLVPDFGNPSGLTTSWERRKRLYELCCNWNIHLIEDCPYRLIQFDGEMIPSLLAMDDRGIVIRLDTTSKIWGVKRLGMISSKNRAVICKADIFVGNTCLCVQAKAQLEYARALALGQVQENIALAREVYQARRDAMLQALAREVGPIEGVSWTKPQGGLFLWLTMPETTRSGQPVNTDSMLKTALEPPYEVAFVPGADFCCDGTGFNQMRLNYSFPDVDTINRAVAKLGRLISDTLAS
ncbi:PLP-dependent aminotransferase family protein [Patescibacteria group bacterium]|nr:PLP-dependent aminotransferase family protein [Patescibacteria group bacterium]